MKNKIKQEKGITMIALIITIIILLILSNILIYNAQDTFHIQALNNLYSDIQTLRDKVSEYYNEYGAIPAKIKYTNITQLKNANLLSSNNDLEDEFYVIDLEAMKGISLNYGKDFETAKNDEENINNYTDLYIINANSHNIFYAQGIGIKQNEVTKIYYTDYTEADETTIDLRYIDGILIPDGYYYIGLSKDNSGNSRIVISKTKGEEIDLENKEQYVWQKQITTIDTVPTTVEIMTREGQTEEEFIKSVNHYKGYFKSTTKQVVYIPIKENKWSEVYTKNEKYTDKNGDEAYIPKGFRVSLAEETNEIRKGLVITDEIDENGNSTGNEFVWIPVSDFYEFKRQDFKSNSEEADYFITTALEEGKFYETEGNGRTVDTNATESIQEAQTLYKSIKEYKGFYIGRYETGIEETVQRTASVDTINTPVIKKNKFLYNYVTWGNSITDETGGAVSIARSMYENSNLCYGVQWDAIMRWINQDTSINYVLTDSSTKGNYDASGNLIKTGNYEEYQIKNIYDLAGNVSEWTMETYGISQKVHRGGASGNNYNITSRNVETPNLKSGTVGFRVALYIK